MQTPSDAEMERRREQMFAEQRSAPTTVLFDGSLIRLRVRGAVCGEKGLCTLKRVYEVAAGCDMYANDIEFAVMEFDDALWIIPDSIALQTHLAWASHLRQVHGFFTASIYWPPRAWLNRGFLGLGRRPEAKIVPLSTMPTQNETWQVRGPLDPKTYQPLS